MTEGRVHRLGDVLREAREAKGVDLVRVERDTKIRERYLSALERGEYRELPGAVYTKGFLRNYGAYLGLDPEYLIDLYRIEAGASAGERSRPAPPPRPLTARKARAFVITPGAIVAALLTVGVGAFIAYLAFEIINFARTPELRIVDPPGNVNGYTADEITIRGVTAPSATIRVDNLRENPTVTADAEGEFEVTVSLVPGSNVVKLTATDPSTGRESPTEERMILVASETGSPTPGMVLSIDEPAADATVQGTVTVRGQAAPEASIQLSVELVEAAAPSFTVSQPGGGDVDLEIAAPPVPEPATLTADASGAYEGSLSLAPGTWTIDVAADGAEPVERTVRVAPADGLRGQLRLDGGDSYLEIDQDSEPHEDVSGTIASDGDDIDLAAEDALRIRAGNAGAVRLTINGIRIASMGDDGAVVEWLIERTD